MNVARGRIIQGIIALMMLGIPAISLYTTIFSIKDCTIIFDHALSSLLCQEIKLHIYTHQIPTNRRMVDEIKKTFPVLQSVFIKQRKSGSVFINCKAYEPLYIVNAANVLLPNNMLVKCDCFTPEILASLSAISVVLTDTSHCPLGLASWVQKVPPDLINRYDITWFDQTKIELIDKLNNKISILLQKNNQVDKALLDYCTNIVPEAVQKKETNRAIVADLRFDGQLVLCCKKGEQ
jgi:hypothetical protein